jgi:hypothetical protein
MPEANPLALLRRDIDRRPNKLKQALRTERIRREFLDGVKVDDGEIVNRFVAHNAENALKTKPKGQSYHFHPHFPDVNAVMCPRTPSRWKTREKGEKAPCLPSRESG